MFYSVMAFALGATMSAQVGVGTSNPRQALDVNTDGTNLTHNLITSQTIMGNTKGIVPSIVADVTAIADPIEGTIAYDLSQHCLMIYSYNGTKTTWATTDLEWTCVSEDIRASIGNPSITIDLSNGDVILLNDGGTSIAQGLGTLLNSLGSSFTLADGTEVIINSNASSAVSINITSIPSTEYDTTMAAKLVIVGSPGRSAEEMQAIRDRMDQQLPTLFLSDSSDDFLTDTTDGFGLSGTVTHSGSAGNYSIDPNGSTHPIITGADTGNEVTSKVIMYGDTYTIDTVAVPSGYTSLLTYDVSPDETGAFVSDTIPFVFSADENIFGDPGDVGTCDDNAKGSYACNTLIWLLQRGIELGTISFD